ncbi:MAG: DUF305 domain-containing protein [Chitinophagaceae bacterium]
MAYRKLLLSLLFSFVVMYGVMFLNVDDTAHIYLSTTRLYMAMLMVTPMAILMVVLMGGMYPRKKTNRVIILSAIAVFTLCLALLRTQTPIGDQQYMKAMIPHHSSAILTSKNANLTDPEVKKLSEQIIKSQEQEIAQMKAILKRMKER